MVEMVEIPFRGESLHKFDEFKIGHCRLW